MLVITLKHNNKTRDNADIVHIGDNVTVKLLQVRGNQIRLGINAPKDVKVFREELLKEEKKSDE